MRKSIAIAGGGAAGFFAAINIAETDQDFDIHIFEKGSAFLQKVKISGGGRCNITHACFEPSELIGYYPRGGKELLGPFHSFNPAHTIEWFAQKRVDIIREKDGRMFPSTNTSQTIIDLFLTLAAQKKIHLHLNQGIHDIQKNKSEQWVLTLSDKEIFHTDYLILTTGNSGQIWNILKKIKHTIVPPVPSLFTFNISDKRLEGLMGVSVQTATCTLANLKISTNGPLLITHWGLSGPAILKLSAWAARELNEKDYNFNIKINFIPTYNISSCMEELQNCKNFQPGKSVFSTNIFNIPERLYRKLCEFAGILIKTDWGNIKKEQMLALAEALTGSIFCVSGKSNFKDEFVTCGGVDLREIDFKTMQSKLHDRLFFAGEILNIDALTGGFNFQAAWTTAYIAAKTICNSNIIV